MYTANSKKYKQSQSEPKPTAGYCIFMLITAHKYKVTKSIKNTIYISHFVYYEIKI